MSIRNFLIQSLKYFARPNLAIIAGVIAATATIAGALIVGDSVRDSLRDMTLSRLGNIQEVLTGPRFLTEQTAKAVDADAIPAILMTGTAKAGDRLAGTIDIVALPQNAPGKLWNDAAFEVEERNIVLNARVAKSLGVGVDDRVELLVEIPESVPRDSLLGERDEVLTELAFTVSQILPEQSGVGRFSLSPAQQLPSVVFVSLPELQDALDISEIQATQRTTGRLGRVNTVLIPVDEAPLADPTEVLSQKMSLEDIDVRLVEAATEGVVSIESRSQIVPNPIADAGHEAARKLERETEDVLVYLVNEIQNAKDSSKFSTYSVLAGIESFDRFAFENGAPSGPLKDDEIVINRWLADDLAVEVGDSISIAYLEVGDTGDLPEEHAEFRVVGIIEMKGVAIDRTLTPTVPGITDANTFADWDQPFTMDLNRVTDRDEEYWKKYRATPKMFISLEEMQARFGSRYGDVTSIRVANANRRALGEALLESVDVVAVGLAFRDVRSSQLRAAQGTTDFSGLFFGFSMFLIASAILLIGLLFRLGVETRVRQLGLLRAVGWTPKRITQTLLSEGLVLSCIGAALGLIAAVAYAALMLYGLTTWWSGASGTQFLSLHVTPTALVVGFIIAVFVSLTTMWFSVRKLNHQEPLSLLSGQAVAEAAELKSSPIAKGLAYVCLPVALLLLAALLVGVIPNVEAFAGFSWRVVGFFLVGAMLLVGELALFALRLNSSKSTSGFGLSHLGWQNLARARGRSLLTASLISCATFLLVAVAVAKKDPTAEEPKIDSGNGGYRLVAESATPILTDIATESGRFDAQFMKDRDDPLFDNASIASLRMRPGDDASCLNLYSARLPTLLGVPENVLKQWSEQGRFRFADTPGETPWLSLLSEADNSKELSIPVIGDMNTIQYSLHKGVGQTFPVPTEVHENAELQVAGMLDGSVFQGVLLMSEQNLRRLDPGIVGYRYFLMETSSEQAAELTSLLESGFADYGFDIEPVAARIANFLAVQNTYLSTFQALGGLGLLLGTLGLGTVMLRNVVERTRELALMRAIGFSPARLRTLVLGENALLLVSGLTVGAITALLAMIPHIMSAGANVPWVNLGVLLFAVLLVGMGAAAMAVRHASSIAVVDALKSE